MCVYSRSHKVCLASRWGWLYDTLGGRIFTPFPALRVCAALTRALLACVRCMLGHARARAPLALFAAPELGKLQFRRAEAGACYESAGVERTELPWLVWDVAFIGRACRAARGTRLADAKRRLSRLGGVRGSGRDRVARAAQRRRRHGDTRGAALPARGFEPRRHHFPPHRLTPLF